MSPVTVWRLVRQCFAADPFDGEGARRFGGRWSPPGLNVAYAAESRALAALEILANVRDPRLLVLQPWVVISAEIPGECIERPERVPTDWRSNPPTPATQAFGAAWVQSRRSLALRVPSAVVGGEFNFLLNPAHPDFPRLALGPSAPFLFDPRLAR